MTSEGNIRMMESRSDREKIGDEKESLQKHIETEYQLLLQEKETHEQELNDQEEKIENLEHEDQLSELKLEFGKNGIGEATTHNKRI